MLRFLTSGESHGKCLIAILEGMVANLPLSVEDINRDLERRQQGWGRGGRMSIEKDQVEILSGVRFGLTLGSPICLKVENKDWDNWEKIMTPHSAKDQQAEAVTKLRPGHADLAGVIKYNQKDVRNILERASARETAARVALGGVAKKLLSQFKISISSSVIHIGGKSKEKDYKELIDKAKSEGNSLGGVFEVKAVNVPPGLGSHVHYDRKLDGLIAQALMSIPAIKGVEIGLGFESALLKGSKVHDEITYGEGQFKHKTNHAGGLEGGISNGEPILARCAMKPISTLTSPLHSVDLKSKMVSPAHVERSDICAVEAAAVIGEAMLALVLAQAFLEKFGGDSLEEVKDNFSAFQKRLSMI